jgi:hypothetical protein
LLLDFTSGAGFDSRVTFTRGSNATLVDSTGKITYAPANLVTYSEQFDNAAWIKYEGTVTANATTAPDGTTTADAFIESTTATTDHRLTFAGASAAVGQNLTLSVYAKANGRNFIALFSVTENKGKYFSIPADGTGAVLGDFGTAPNSAAISYVGNGWYRCSITYTATAASQNVRYYPCDTGATFIYTGNGTSGIFVWGAQLQPVTYQTVPGTYNATTTAAYYGPRFDYNPVTLAAKGLLIEEQRTNLLLQSQFVSGWTTNGGTTTFNASGVTSPDGTTNGRTVNDTSAAAAAYVYQAVSFTSGTVYSMSVYVKKGVSTFFQIQSFTQVGLARFNLATNTLDAISGIVTSATITNAGGGWYRCTATMTASATASNNVGYGDFEAGPTGDLFSVYGAQVEAGAFATSYIPTVASQVTRSADAVIMTGTNFSSWYTAAQGTFVVSADVGSVGSGDKYVLLVNDANGRVAYVNTASINTFDGTTVTSSGQSAVANTPFNVATAWSGSTLSISANGATAVGGAFDGTMGTGTELRIGMYIAGSAGAINGHIQQVAFYNTRLTNAQLQTLTAPQMNTTLRLDFINGIYEG